MRELSINETSIISGAGSDTGRDVAVALGGLAGGFVAGPAGAAAGTVAGGAVYDYASTHTATSSMSPSGLGGTLQQKPASIPSEAWNVKAGRECYFDPNNLNDICH